MFSQNILLTFRYIHDFLSSADFFSKLTFKKILSGTLSKCQTAWIQMRTDVMLALILVQMASKGYQQTTKVNTSMKQEKIWH